MASLAPSLRQAQRLSQRSFAPCTRCVGRSVPPKAYSSSVPSLAAASPLRRFQTAAPRKAVYQRFPMPGGGGSGGGRLSSSGALSALFRRMFGSNGRPPVLLVVILGGAGVYYVFHLERVEETGRWRFIDVGLEQERQLGIQTYRETLQEYRGRILSPSDPTSVYVRRVASRIVAALDAVSSHPSHTMPAGADGVRHGTGEQVKDQGTDWEVFVIKDDEQRNAFVLPGGKIFVFTGILPICKGEDGLATVLGHEIAHQVARHSAEKMSGVKILIFAGYLLEMLGLDIGLSRLAVTLLLSLPNSRKVETEADYLGLRIMARACYDPSEATNLWERMESTEASSSSSSSVLSSAKALLSTHPVNTQRIQKIQTWLPEAKAVREEADCPSRQVVGGFRDAFAFAGAGAGARAGGGAGRYSQSPW